MTQHQWLATVGRHSAFVTRWLTILGMGVALGMLALGTGVLVEARQDVWHQAEQASANLARALEQDIARNVAIYDLSMQGAASALRQPGIDQASPEIRQMALFDSAASAEYLGSLLVLDGTGNIVADSTSLVPHKLNFADRDYFTVHRDRPDAGLYISRPYRSRMRDGDPSIALSRRLSGPDGRFAGVVLGALRLAYFHKLFGNLDVGSKGAVTLLRTDGLMLVREPFREADIGRDVSGFGNTRRFLAAPSGRFVATARIDGVRRLYVFRHVGNLPLVLVVAVSTDEIYAAWWRKAVAIGSALAVLCGATIALCLLFRGEVRRRLKAEAALSEAAEKLSTMAATDGLTGLANRRALETALDREWPRATRGDIPLSLLMLDADRFKLYNDAHGHQAGDRVLQGIAACVRGNLLRPGDLAARYGGEEFVVLLPETDEPGALAMAERIRAAVEALAIPHAHNPAGRVTVSIGAATTRPRPGETASRLVESADEALYAAKRGGRNRVGMAEPGLTPAGPGTLLLAR